MKKRFGVAAFAMAAGCAVIFAGCTGCNGCGANGKSNEAAFSSNWYADTNYRYIQPTFTEGKDNFAKEEITYTVEHDTESASNTSYSVKYADSTYKTTFYATTLPKHLINEEYSSTYPENDITVYYYKTELDIPSITFKVGEDTKTFTDKYVLTESYFMDVNNHLRPLYSAQKINMASPAEYQVNSIGQSYLLIDQDVFTYYKYDGSAAKTEIVVRDYEGTPNVTTSVTGLGDTDNSLIDVNGLNIAVRAMQLSASMSQVISVYSPSGKMQNYTFAGSSIALNAEERKSYEGILAGKQLYKGGDDSSLNTVCVTATLNASNDMTGVSQKYWFAAIDNAKNNTGRATMVKMSVPLAFNLGTVNYSLNEIKSTLYNN
ncbi:MAG: hypothetical protein K2K38_04140 [Clostridia bacterium]|nr:hypothetical protein [Clostridia bacterium]